MISFKTTDFKLRLIVGLFALFVTLSLIYFATYPSFQPFFTLFLAAIISIALWEYYQMAKIKGFKPPELLAITCSVAYTFATYLSIQSFATPSLPKLVLFFALILLFAYFLLNPKDSLITFAITIAGFVYLTFTLTLTLAIIYSLPSDVFPDGRYYFFYVLTVTKMHDTGAYFFGKRFGTLKLAPFISPNKTWEGTLGGIFTSLIAGVILAMVPQFISENTTFLTLTQALFLSLLIGVLAQFGDLAESVIKRDAGVKDSSQLPGLGGVLDMVDSLIFTIPLMHLFLEMQKL